MPNEINYNKANVGLFVIFAITRVNYVLGLWSNDRIRMMGGMKVVYFLVGSPPKFSGRGRACASRADGRPWGS